MFRKKRGVSPVIATILIVLLTVTAVAILARFIIPFVKENLETGTECLDYRGYFTFVEDSDYNCYYINNKKYAVSVRAGVAGQEAGKNIAGFRLVLVSLTGSKSIEVREDSTEIDRLGGKMIIPNPGEWFTYAYTSDAEEIYSAAEVYPVLKSGRICEITDSINLVDCTQKGTRL